MDKNDHLRPQRLVSLDIFRGLTMFLLVAETAGVTHALGELVQEGTWAHSIYRHFHHHEWNGLLFWDLVQPFFMFIVGVAMAYSVAKREEAGESWGTMFRHILVRCLLLLMFGVGLHCIYARELCWELWNVLSQLSVTVLIAFLLMRYSAITQIGVSVLLLVATEIAYRTWSVEGFDQPFVKGHNFGSWVDMQLMGKTSSGGWVAINCIPTAAHTIWGVVAGQMLRSSATQMQKVGMLVVPGALMLAIGYGLDAFSITPIIKRICTSSFVVASGGWCLIVLAFFYWLADIVGLKRWGFFFVVIGMNPIFIYLLSETIGRQWLNGTVAIFVEGALIPLVDSKTTIHIASAVAVLALEWWLCLWLYRRNILIKL